MKEMENNTDQRHFTRIEIDAPADLVTVGAEPQTLKGVCRDLSAGGMLLQTQQSLAPGTQLQVTLRSHYGNEPMLSCKAKVVRSYPAEEKVILGLEILEFLD